MPKQSGVFAKLKAASKSEGRPPSLYRWFLTHHDEFAKILARLDRPTWEVIVTVLQSEGLTLKSGERLTTGYARQAWWKAHKAYKAKRASLVMPQAVPAPRGREVAYGVTPVVPVQSAGTEPSSGGQQFALASLAPSEFVPSKPFKDSSSTSKPSSTPTPVDVDEVIRRLQGGNAAFDSKE